MTADGYGNTLPGYHDGKDDVLEPLPLYRDRFRDAFSQLASEAFERMVAEANVDTEANAVTCTEINRLEEEKEKFSGKKGFGVFLLTILWLALAGALTYIGVRIYNVSEYATPFFAGIMPWCLVVTPLIIICLILLHQRNAALKKKIDQLTAAIQENTALAYRQMEKLNEAYSWDIIQELITQTVPRIAFDPYFTESRLSDLREYFGYDDCLYTDRSVLFAQSGELNGNPFVFAEMLAMQWGTHTYTGYKKITWTTRERGSDGKMRTVRHYQTLTASVTKPIPEYSTNTVLIFGSEAAPELSFSRGPSELSGAEDSWWNNLKKKRTISKLEEYSRNLEDDSDYTIMGNREFEALFHAVNRDDEVGFRLLFTSLAQQQMLALLNDRDVGFGDNFHFIKENKLNFILPEHLSGDFSLDTNPAAFRDYNLERARQNFRDRCEDYFRRIYFALAPLLSIPIYQQTPMHRRIIPHPAEETASYWDHEAMANFLGEAQFAAPDSATRNLLKTSVQHREDGISSIVVTAYGFRAVPRVDYESVWGRDGRCHSVAVEWFEFLPVERSTAVRITEHIGNDMTEWEKRKQLLTEKGYALDRAIHRKSIFCLR